MQVTVSLNEKLTAAAQQAQPTDLRALVQAHSHAEILRVFGRGRFASIETTAADLQRLKNAIGDRCVFALKADVVAF